MRRGGSVQNISGICHCWHRRCVSRALQRHKSQISPARCVAVRAQTPPLPLRWANARGHSAAGAISPHLTKIPRARYSRAAARAIAARHRARSAFAHMHAPHLQPRLAQCRRAPRALLRVLEPLHDTKSHAPARTSAAASDTHLHPGARQPEFPRSTVVMKRNFPQRSSIGDSSQSSPLAPLALRSRSGRGAFRAPASYEQCPHMHCVLL